jgi:hypothetical protein
MAGQAGSALGDAVESVKAHAGQVTEHVSSHMPLLNNDKSGQSGGGMDMGGLAGGMLALGLGFMAGLSIPETERERAAMEPVRSMLHEQMDKLGLDEMRGDAADLMESVKQAGSEVVSSAKDTLSSARQ